MSRSNEDYFNDLIQAFREVEVTWQFTSKDRLESASIDTLNILFHQTQNLINASRTAKDRRKCWKKISKICKLLYVVDLTLNYAQQ